MASFTPEYKRRKKREILAYLKGHPDAKQLDMSLMNYGPLIRDFFGTLSEAKRKAGVSNEHIRTGYSGPKISATKLKRMKREFDGKIRGDPTTPHSYLTKDDMVVLREYYDKSLSVAREKIAGVKMKHSHVQAIGTPRGRTRNHK